MLAKSPRQTRSASVSETRYYGRPRAYTRKDGEIRPTVVSLPSRPSNEYTAKNRRRALDEAEFGNIARLADLWRASLKEFGANDGIVSTIVRGIMGLPLNLHGNPEMVAALTDCDETPGDFSRLFPESEAGQVFLDGIGLGVGLGQMVVSPYREIGERNIPRMKWWNPRHLRQDTNARAWYLHTYDGEVEVRPGDGEWILFTPYGATEPWTHAPARWATLAFVFARDAAFDRQRHSEVCSPTRVMRADKPTTAPSRAKALKLLESMQRDNKFVLPEQYIFEIVESTGKVADIYQAIIEWAERQWIIGWTGQTVTTDGGKAFTSGTIHERIAASNLRFSAKVWFDCLYEQYLSPHWARENFGTYAAPTGGYNIRPPQDISAEGAARTQWALGIKETDNAAKQIGGYLDPLWVVEDAQKRGIRIVLPETLDVEGQGTENDLPTPGYAERVAEMLNAHNQDRCRHGNPNSCQNCGVRREDELVAGVDGSVGWRIHWVPRDPALQQAPEVVS